MKLVSRSIIAAFEFYANNNDNLPMRKTNIGDQ